MTVGLTGLIAVCGALALIVTFSNSQTGRSQTTQPSVSNGLSQVEQDLLTEINLARTHPGVYAAYLEALKPMFKGNLYTRPGHGTLTTVEGWSAVEEAIKFVRAAKPQSPLSLSNGLRLAAVTHCTEQSRSGSTGHKGGGGLIEDRVKPFGTWQGAIGESLSYGDDLPRERVLTWLIDDGVASRGHRKRLLSPDFRTAGIACTPHPEFRKVCALTLAGSFLDSDAAKSSTTVTTNTNVNQSKTRANTNTKTKTNKGKTTTNPPSF